MIRSLLLIFILALANGCTHAVHLNHQGDIQPMKGKEFTRIKAEGEQHTILGMVQQTDYVNEAFAQLEEKCPDGKITGIQTRYSTSHGFFSWTNKVKMIAYCVL